MNFLDLASSKLEDVLEWVLFWAGIVLSFLGFVGVLIIFSEYEIISDKILQTAFTFVSFYMLFFGLFLIFCHKKIVVDNNVELRVKTE